MEVVVFHSDISRLVLGYLTNQGLKRAARVFCKTSPHLKQEFSAFKHGLQAHSFFPDLEEIICAYVKISRKMEQVLASMPIEQRTELEHKKVSEKVIELMERASQALLRETPVVTTKAESAVAGASGSVIQSDKENNTKKLSGIKRKRADNSADYSTDEQKKCSYAVSKRKRRHVLQPFCYINDKRDRVRHQSNLTIPSTSTCDENSDDNSNESCDDDNEATSKLDDEDSVDMSISQRHVNESTPREKPSTSHFMAPSLPEISQAILENSEFQLKLVDNINHALLRSTDVGVGGVPTHDVPPFVEANNGNSAVINSTNNVVSANSTADEQEILTSHQLLDQMVQSILDATEKDPTFDVIIQEVLEASNKGTASAGIQCNLQNYVPSASSAGICVPPQPPQPTRTNSVTNASEPVNKPIGALTNAPHTPLVIRSAIATANSEGCDPQTLPSYTANTSFGSLIDPNYSISKLIVLNSNESAQKQVPAADQTIVIGNQTADNILNQLTNTTQPPTEDQIYFDAATGQLTFPLFLTTDGLLTNFPFLINNEVVTQQLQPENVINMESSRIEIPLAEPIIVSADQLPPNSIIVGSTQKKDEKASEDKEQRTVSKLKKDISTVPASLDSRIIPERVTPSTSGIMNVKAFRSLSTPRKRTSHVRTLSFSPKTDKSRVGATPLSSRRKHVESCVLKPVAEEVSEKPIIENIEILRPPTSIENSVNESSNSSHVPVAFVSEESNNQTIIKNDRRANAFEPHVDTPKKKQLRNSALRACKRQLSKSSNEEEPVETEKQKASAETLASTDATDATKTDPKDELLNEWRRMRTATTSDLDVRLRELNSKLVGAIKKEPTKRVRRRRPVAVKKRSAKAQAKADEEAETLSQDSNEDSSGKVNTKKKKQKKDLKEFRIKIPTPQKHEKARIKILHEKEKGKENQEIKAIETTPEILMSHTCEVTQFPPCTREVLERRTNNIACLLETPFKEPSTSASLVPQTPGVCPPQLDTPLSKLLPSDDDRLSTSYLFGSLTKSELGTPMFNAITPGLRFTPFVTKDCTPQSTAATEYSSGGSYYRPDESEDVNKKLDEILRSSAQKLKADENGMTPTQPPPSESFNIINSPAQLCVEVPFEKLKVEPIILKRVKSFGMEEADGPPTEAEPKDMHYSLAPGLPEAVTLEDEEESSSSDDSSSTYSSTTSSSSGSSSSSSSSSSSAASKKSAKKSKTPLITSLDNLSNISSTEDVDWQKLEKGPNEMSNSQLVNDEGEVRYPLRNWLSPQKMPLEPPRITPLKSAEKQPNELELKRERIKTKLEEDKQKLAQKTKATPLRKPKQKNVGTSNSNKTAAIDVLTALNLSAKKQPPNRSSACKQMLPMADIDDNAVSNIFSGSNVTPNAKPEMNSTKAGPRQIQLIERRPITKAKPTKQKRVVRTPLGFQGPAATSIEDEGRTEPPPIKVKQVSKERTSSAGTGANTANRVSARVKSRSSEVAEESEKKDDGDKLKTPTKATQKPTTKSNSKTTTRPRGRPKAATATQALVTGELNKATAKRSIKSATTPKVKKTEVKTAKEKPKPREKKVEQKKLAEEKAIGEKNKTGIAGKRKDNRVIGDEEEKIQDVQNKKLGKREIDAKEEEKCAIGGTVEEIKKGVSIRKDKKAANVEEDNKTNTSKKEQSNSSIDSYMKEKPKNEKDTKERHETLDPNKEQELVKEIVKEGLVETIVHNEPPSVAAHVIVAPSTTTAPINVAASHALHTPSLTIIQQLPDQNPLNMPRSFETTSAIRNITSSDEDDDYELDPIDCCKLVSIPESDTKRIVSLTDNGIGGAPKTAPIRHDFSDFKMVVNIDEHESHTWRITEEIVLYESDPKKEEEAFKTIRNIPKKRRIRVITTSSSDESTAFTCARRSQESNPSQTTPGATSTPVARTTPRAGTIRQQQDKTTNLSANSDQNSTLDPHSPSFVKPSQTEFHRVLPETHTASAPLTTRAVEIVDIESILSHLHGE